MTANRASSGVANPVIPSSPTLTFTLYATLEASGGQVDLYYVEGAEGEHTVFFSNCEQAATEATLVSVLSGVTSLVSGIDAANVNLADLEALVGATNTAIAALEVANDASGDDIVTAVGTLDTSLSALLSALQTSNESHSDEVRDAVVSLEAAVAAFQTAFDARDLATEAKQDEIISGIGALIPDAIYQRIKDGRLSDGSTGVQLYDIQGTDEHIYVGVIPDAGDTTAGNVSDIIRYLFISGSPSRRGYIIGGNWDNRTSEAYINA